MIIAVPVTADGLVDPRWGKAQTIAIAKITTDPDVQIELWEEHPVGWNVLHDQGAHGTHHARIVKFLKEHNVNAVVINHCGASIMNTMQKMGLVIAVEAVGPAKEVLIQAAPELQRAVNNWA